MLFGVLDFSHELSALLKKKYPTTLWTHSVDSIPSRYYADLERWHANLTESSLFERLHVFLLIMLKWMSEFFFFPSK